MKIKIIFICCFFLTFFTNAQDLLRPLEIAVRTQNFSSNDTITFELEPLGSSWCYNLVTEVFELETSSTSYEVVIGNYSETYYGFDVCYDIADWEPFWIGFYKMNIYKRVSGQDQLLKYFYLDYRDANYGSPTSGCSNDISIKIDNSSGLFYSPQLDDDYTGFNQGDVLNWWEIDQCTTHTTADLPDFWDHALVVIPNNSNNPKLIWGPNEDYPNIAEYKIYRKYNSQSWALYDSVGSDEYTYTDLNVSISSWQTSHYYYYYVKGVYVETPPTEQLTPATNTVSVSVSGSNEDKKNVEVNNTVYDFSLSQNFPNPFNPTTLLNYQIAEPCVADLRVYNSMGEQVAVLVNEQKSPGSYSVKFDGTGLSSGIYFYKLQVGDNVLVKNMLLLK